MDALFYHKTSKIFCLALILAIFLSGCGAVQVGAPIGALQTLQGMQAVINSAPGTLAMAKDTSVLLAWPCGQNYAFALVRGTIDVIPGLNAQSLETLSFAETVLKLQKVGWKIVDPTQLPAAITGAISAYSVELVMLGVQSLPTIFMVPLGPVELPAKPEEIIL